MKNLSDAVRNFKKGVEDVAELAEVNPTNVRRALNGEFKSPRIKKGALIFLKSKLKDLQTIIAKEDGNCEPESKAA